MSDDQTQHPDTVDDAFRQAERQLEAKLEKLRQTALGQSSQAQDTVGAGSWGTATEQESDWQPTQSEDLTWDETPQFESTPSPMPTGDVQTAAPENNWDDAVLRPTGAGVTPAAEVEFEADDEWDSVVEDDEPIADADESWSAPAPARSVPVAATPTTSAPRTYGSGQGSASTDAFGFASDDDQMAHLRTSLRMIQQGTDEVRHTLAPTVTSMVVEQVEGIMRDELSAPAAGIRQVQAQLPAMEDRIARSVADELAGPVAAISQMQDELPLEIQRVQRDLAAALRDNLTPVAADMSAVRDQVGTVDDQLAGLRSALNQLDASLGEDLTRTGKQVEGRIAEAQNVIREDVDRSERAVTERVDSLAGDVQADLARFGSGVREGLTRIESTVRDEMAAPAAAVRQLHDELPAQLQRLERVVRDTNAAPQVEQLIDVTAAQREHVLDAIDRAANRTTGAVTDSHESLSATVTQSTEALAKDVERLSVSVDHDVTRLSNSLETTVRSEFAETANNVRSIVELDLGGLFADLIHAGRATLDKLGSVDQDLNRDRVQGAEDLELMVDALTAGFTGMHEAFVRVTQKVGMIEERIAGVENNIAAFDNLAARFEDSVEMISSKLDTDLGAMRTHLAELQPAPVVVTIAHPDAKVEQTTRGGFTGGKDSESTSSK